MLLLYQKQKSINVHKKHFCVLRRFNGVNVGTKINII